MAILARTRAAGCPNWPRTLQACLRPFLSRSLSSAPSPASRNNGHPCRIAVIGSGPAGFYTAYRAMAKIKDAKVDMYESLPVPFGLVRFGVAPDHPEVKNCQEKFEEVASSPNFTFIGNVSVGHPNNHPDGISVSLSSILRHYNAIVFAYGASKDRTLGIPGESLRGVYSAREFVGWYNGLPEHADLAPDLTRGEEAVIIGQGNVALDVARMLLEDVSVLRKSDIAAHAIDTLSRSTIRRVHIVGRRGPMQAAFTIKEIRELMRLPSIAFHPIPSHLIPPDPSTLPRAPRRLAEILLKGSPTPPSSPSSAHTTKSWSLDFLLSPKSFLPTSSDPTRLSTTSFELTTLSPNAFSPHAYALPTGAEQRIPSSVAFRSIGYKAAPLDEFSSVGIPFDETRGVITNDGSGRVQHEERNVDATTEMARFPGLYCAGWVKRGPTGVIASTMQDAFGTADAIAEDWMGGRREFLNEGSAETMRGWEGVRWETGVDEGKGVVHWEGWKSIDGVERERGKRAGKEREKFVRTEDMLAVLG